MNRLDMVRAIRRELFRTGEDITIDHLSSFEAFEESQERWEEFRKLVRRIGELARKK